MTHDPIPVTHTWTITDDTAPETTITSAPTPTTDSGTAAFQFEADEPNVTFECSLDGEGFGACTSPLTYDGLSLGGHTFAVQATDSAGNAEPSPATHAWTVTADTTPPNTTVTPGLIDGLDALFDLGGTDTGTPADQLTFRCQLDAGPVEPCDTPHEYSDLTRGEHVIKAAAIDLAGNVDPNAGRVPVPDRRGDQHAARHERDRRGDDASRGRARGLGRTDVHHGEPAGRHPHRAPHGAPPVTGEFEAGARTYDIGTTATYSGTVLVCVEFDPAEYADPLRVRLLHHEGGAWVDVTGPGSELDNGIVCGRVSSLSPFADRGVDRTRPRRGARDDDHPGTRCQHGERGARCSSSWAPTTSPIRSSSSSSARWTAVRSSPATSRTRPRP